MRQTRLRVQLFLLGRDGISSGSRHWGHIRGSHTDKVHVEHPIDDEKNRLLHFLPPMIDRYVCVVDLKMTGNPYHVY